MARSWRFAGRLAAVGLVGVVSTGCESMNDSEYEVTGKISYRGEPIRGGVVLLAPAERAKPWGIGVIKQDGEYYVMSSEARKPMGPGRYDVSFRRPVQPVPVPGSPYGAPSAQIPEKYLDVESPFFSIELKHLPCQVDITLRD
jgi:hypothetical protein